METVEGDSFSSTRGPASGESPARFTPDGGPLPFYRQPFQNPVERENLSRGFLRFFQLLHDL